MAHTYREMGLREQAVAAYRTLLQLQPGHGLRAEYEAWIGEVAP